MSKKKLGLSELELLIVDLHDEAVNNANSETRYKANSLLRHYLQHKKLTAKQVYLANQIIN